MSRVDYGPPAGTAGDPLVRTSRAQGGAFPITGNLNERIAQVITTRFEQAEASLKGRFERFYRYEKLVYMISKKKSYEWKANAYLPYALSAAEQSAAIKFLQLLALRPIVGVTSRRGGMEDIADHREAHLNWRFEGDVNIMQTGAEMLRIAERYGKAIALVAPEWDHKVLKYRERVNLPTVLGPISRLAWKTTQSKAYQFRFEPLDNTDVFPQAGFKRINGVGAMRYINRRYHLTIDELRALQEDDGWGPQLAGQSVDEIRDTNEQDLNEFKARRLFMDKYDDFENFRDQYDRSTEIIEYQGEVPDELIDPDLANMEENAGLDPKKRVMALANRKVVGFNQAMPWDHGMKSYIEMDCIPDPYGFWGTGKPEIIEHLIYVGNEVMNMRLDNVKAAVNGLIGVDGSRMPAGWKRRLVSQPWGVVETNGAPNDVIQRLNLGDVTASSYQEQSQVFGLIQEATSLNETMLGASGGTVRTLGEHQMKAEFGGRRLNFELVTQAQQLFGATRKSPGLVYFILGLDRQYLPIGQWIQVVNPDVPDSFLNVPLGPEDLAAENEDFIYTISGSIEGMNRQQKRVDLAQLFQLLGPMFPIAASAGANFIELMKMALRAHEIDPDRIFPKLPGTSVSPDSRGEGTGPEMIDIMNPQPAQGTQGGSQRPAQRARKGGGRPISPAVMRGVAGGRPAA